MQAELAMKNLRPFWGRVSVVESPVEETELESHLIVPFRFDGDDGIKRGVVVEADRIVGGGGTEPWYEALQPGTVVFYRGGVRIGDIVILEMNEILAIQAE